MNFSEEDYQQLAKYAQDCNLKRLKRSLPLLATTQLELQGQSLQIDCPQYAIAEQLMMHTELLSGIAYRMTGCNHLTIRFNDAELWEADLSPEPMVTSPAESSPTRDKPPLNDLAAGILNCLLKWIARATTE